MTIEIHPHTAHEPCPGGCEDMLTVEKRLASGATRMNSIEGTLTALGKKLDDHMATSTETNNTVGEVLEILHAGKGFFRIMGYVTTAVKWIAGLAAPLIGLWFVIKEGVHK